MILIPKGQYTIGSKFNLGHPDDNEIQPTTVTVNAFFIDKTSVSNADFAQFVKDTAYVTVAERLGSSFVFKGLLLKNMNYKVVADTGWWLEIEGASWRFPYGDTRSYEDYLNHPVVHVCIEDALAYCKWADKRLPNEIEWEIAAQGEDATTIYPWGNDLFDSLHRCNVWQGRFPTYNSFEDGYIGTSPVQAFYLSAKGVYQMIGNVWEMCFNKARIDLTEVKQQNLLEQLKTFDSEEIQSYASKGGSFLCHDSYCNRARTSSRNSIDVQATASNLGFRCVRDK